MRIQRVLLAVLTAVFASFAFSSCVNEAPEINYVVEYTHNSDFSSIIEAIKSQSTTISQKLDAVKTAVSEGFMTMEEASSALKDALVESLENQNTTLSDIRQAIESQNLLLEDKLDLLTAAVDNQTAALEDKLDLLTAAVDNQTVSLKEALGVIDTSIKDQTKALQAKLDLINETIETGAANLVDAIAAFEETMDEALAAFEETMDEDLQDLTQATNIQTIAIGMMGNAIVNAINNGVTTLEDALAAIEEAIDNQTTALEAQLVVIAQAIEQAASTVEGAIDDGAVTIEEALEALGGVIEGAIEGGVEDITGALSDFADAVAESIDGNTEQLEAIVGKLEELKADFATYNEPLAGYIQDIIDAIYESHGVTPPTPPTPTPRYEVIDGVLYMNQAAYDEISAADDWETAIKAKLEENQIEPTVPEITTITTNRMNYRRPGSSNTHIATVYPSEADNPVYKAYISDYEDPAESDDKLVKKVDYYSVAFDFNITGYGASLPRPNQNRAYHLHWSFDGENWTGDVSATTHDSNYGGTCVYYVNGLVMVDDVGFIIDTIYFDYIVQ